MIQNYNQFVETLLTAGFSLGGGNDKGIYAIIPWGWQQEAPYPTPVSWHTGQPDTDPWEWRMRVLNERNDIAYAKLFFKQSGFITKEWYPYFLAARRNNTSFAEAYEAGILSHHAKRIYTAIEASGVLPSHIIKTTAGFTKEEKPAFDRALVELQMAMYITMCGQQVKINSAGEEYGWSSNVFCTTDVFFGAEMMTKANTIDETEAYEKIKTQVLTLNPLAEEKTIKKFILG